MNLFTDGQMHEVSQIFPAAIEGALNAYLKLDPEYKKKLKPLCDKVIEIEFVGIDEPLNTLYILPDHSGIQIMYQYSGETDTLIKGTPLALMQMGFVGNNTNFLFSGDVSIAGDLELGQEFKRMLVSLDIDWEEWLSKICGDFVAHKSGNLARTTYHWGQQAVDIFAQDVADYLQQEKDQLPYGDSIRQFLADVDQLRDDVDRMEVLILRMQDKLSPHPKPTPKEEA